MKRLALALFLLPLSLAAQDRLRSMPGYEAAQRAAREGQSAIAGGAPAVTWLGDSDAFDYERDGIHYRFDVKARQAKPIEASASRSGRAGSDGLAEPERGRQFDSTISPDGRRKAHYQDRNVWVSDDSSEARAVSTDGSAESRIKYGTASWVYGEELSQRTAMWWCPTAAGSRTTASMSGWFATTTSR